MRNRKRSELLRAPADDLIADHRARIEYEQKQKEEGIPRRRSPRDMDLPVGGCASIAGEFYHGGEFEYCRDRSTCKAELTIARQKTNPGGFKALLPAAASE